MSFIWENERKTSKFVDAGSNNRNEKEGNYQHGMGRQRRMKEEEKKTLHTETCANIDSVYMNKRIYYCLKAIVQLSSQMGPLSVK